MEIKTKFINPPISSRKFDWQATQTFLMSEAKEIYEF